MEDIKKIKISDKDYPKDLKKISNAPEIIYYRGKIKSGELRFAVVGTRRNSFYGKQTTLEIAGDLAKAGLVIVSGLAPGIDTFSHLAAVENGKRTIAVLGTGLDKNSIYPKENIALSEKIIKLGGCLISEYPPGTRATRFTFPQRNRIISGLSKGVLVIEAKEKSGSLITAGYAIYQKRKLFAVPGPLHSPNSQGTNLLIKHGAKLVSSANDILEELELKDLIRNNKNEEPETNEEKLIIDSLKEESLYIDKIIEKTKLSAAVAASTLTILEMKGMVRNLGSNNYALAN